MAALKLSLIDLEARWGDRAEAEMHRERLSERDAKAYATVWTLPINESREAAEMAARHDTVVNKVTDSNSLGGFFYSLNLSDELREALQPMARFR